MGGSYCYVRGCKTGYSSQRKSSKAEGKRMLSLFVAPRDIHLFEKWKRVIGSADKELTRQDRICELHFNKEDIQRYYVHKLTNGTTDILKRGRPILRAGAVPLIDQNRAHSHRRKRVTKVKPENEVTETKCSKKDEEEDSQEGEEERSAMNIMGNILDEVTDAPDDDTSTCTMMDETNARTNDPKVDGPKSTIPIIITDVRSMDNKGSLGERSEGSNFPGLKTARGQGISIKRVEIQSPVRLSQLRQKIAKKRPKEKENLQNETSPSCSRQQTFMESLEKRFASFVPSTAFEMEGRSKEEHTTSGDRFTNRNQQEENEDMENFKTKRQRQDTDNFLEDLPLTLQSPIVERLDAMNRNIETNTCALSILSKTIGGSSKEHIRALNNLTAAITKVGSLLLALLDQNGGM